MEVLQNNARIVLELFLDVHSKPYVSLLHLEINYSCSETGPTILHSVTQWKTPGIAGTFSLQNKPCSVFYASLNTFFSHLHSRTQTETN